MELIFIPICIELWYQGGQNNRAWMRDVLIPIILGVLIGMHTVWWIGLLSIGSFNIIRIGYGIPDATDEGSFLGRIFKLPWLTRGIAGVLYGLIGLSCWVFYTKHLYIYLLYAFINFGINALGEALEIDCRVADRIRGLAISTIIIGLLL